MIPDLIYFIKNEIPSAKIIYEKYNDLICVNITHPDNQTSEGRIYTYDANNLRGFNFKRVDPHTYTKVIISKISLVLNLTEVKRYFLTRNNLS